MTENAQVLVVDDDRAVGLVLSGLLKQAGHESAYVASAEEALGALSPPAPLELVELTSYWLYRTPS